VKTFQLAVSLRPTAGSAHISRPITTSIITWKVRALISSPAAGACQQRYCA
jgi:hypothetical protein